MMPRETITYTNDSVECPRNLVETPYKSLVTNREFFLGICSCCYTYKDNAEPLYRCSGCQLLAYCSKICQKADWPSHKPVCKTFALKNGRNALSEVQKFKKDDRNKAMDSMKAKALEAASDISDDQEDVENYFRFVEGMFDWARVCNICKEARMDKLTDCACRSVSYCSERHRKADKAHREECDELRVYARTISYFQSNSTELNLPMNNEVYNEYVPLTRMDFNMSSINDEWLDAKLAILSERMAVPLTILYAMQESGLGINKTPVESVSSLNIHVVSPRPMLDSRFWENLMHRLPLLDELNISFVGVNMKLVSRLNIDIANKLERCADCKSRNRLITYNIYPQHYHMYFSSMDYEEPDIIAIFNNKEIYQQEEDDVHDVTSYRNMTYDEGTLVLLTESEESELYESIRLLNEARPVDLIIDSRSNPVSGWSSIRGKQGKPLINVLDHMACVRRK